MASVYYHVWNPLIKNKVTFRHKTSLPSEYIVTWGTTWSSPVSNLKYLQQTTFYCDKFYRLLQFSGKKALSLMKASAIWYITDPKNRILFLKRALNKGLFFFIFPETKKQKREVNLNMKINPYDLFRDKSNYFLS